jgi:2-polyprenyl-6-methoxyphenol hydroxylase-like FAD-dependent oxidoreductase
MPMAGPERGDRTEVLIVGGGPVGLALAADLGWRGVSCVLVERRDGSIALPKMNMVSGRTMEFCRRWGISQDVRKLSIAEDFPRGVLFVTSANGYELARYDYPSRADAAPAHSPEYLQRCSQFLFDPLIRQKAEGFACVELLHQTELLDFSQNEAGVAATLVGIRDGRRRTIHARYLVACDGADSSIRQRLDIPLLGEMALSHSLNVYFESDDFAAILPRRKAIMQWLVDDSGYWGGIVTVDAVRRWRLGVRNRPTQQAVSAAEAAALVRKAVGRDFRFNVVSSLDWTRRSVVAERYLKGRVFLVGDAAHQLSPTGGFGMNTGIADAIDISWKLAATLAGWGGPRLLESYDLERRPIGVSAVREGAQNFAKLTSIESGPEIEHDSEAGEALRRRIGHHIYTHGFEQEYESDGLIFGYHYEGSPIVAHEPGAPPAATVKRYVPTSRPGHRAPHAWIGPDRSTLDLLGHGFVLLCKGGGDADPLIKAARSRGMPITVEAIGDGEAGQVYERRLTLVRPDGHVAWRGDRAPADAGALVDQVRGA